MAPDIQDFYERYPYPRPIESLDKYRQLWQDERRRRADHHLASPAKPYRDDPTILIAGCGTSQAAKHAMRWPNARVTGIDFSATSVRHTEALKRKYRLDNLDVRPLSIAQAADLDATFDRVVCTGVLHHLRDPDAGLRALRGVLGRGGTMHLMVYAPYGRTGVYMLQDFCRRIGIAATADGISDLVGLLGALPDGHPLRVLLREAPDFRDEAALADALLHPQDRAYSVPQFFDFVERAGLAFSRWLKQAPYGARCGIFGRVPQLARVARLQHAEQYAAVELFRGTMLRHSAVLCRDDEDVAQPITFATAAWRDYVPMHAPDVVCVEERLPPGAAAVLINRTHTYTDLYLPIGAGERRWFERIDGRRTISEVVGGGDDEQARAHFERLWWHDLVVFDASRVTTSQAE